jgi:hypothetical protein
VLSGVALAVTKACITNPCEGTSGPDTLIGNATNTTSLISRVPVEKASVKGLR